MQSFGRSITVFALLALAGAVVGCATRYPQLSLEGGYPPNQASHPALQSAPAGAPIQYRTATGSLPTYGGSGLSTGTAAPAPRKENPVSATFKKVTGSVAEALTIKPKVIRAQDPTSLSSNPGPIGADLYVSAARLAESQGEPAAAQKQYEQALAIQADCLPALIGLSRLHHRRGEIDLAIRYGMRAVQAHPDSAVAHNDLGLCYARQKRFDSAILSLSQAVHLQPRSKLYRNNLAASLVFANRIDEAEMQLRQAHGDAAASYNLGYLLYQQGRADESVVYFQRALQLDPQLRPAAQMLMRLRAQGSAQTIARPDTNRRFHQVGIEPPRDNVRRPGYPTGVPATQNDTYPPSRRLPPVTEPMPRMRELLSRPADQPREDTAAPQLDSSWPDPAPTQPEPPAGPSAEQPLDDTSAPQLDSSWPDPALTQPPPPNMSAQEQPPTSPRGDLRGSEFELPPVVSPDDFSRPSPGPSSRRIHDAPLDRNSGFPTDTSGPSFDLPAGPPASAESTVPQNTNRLDFSPFVPSTAETGEALPPAGADDGAATPPPTAGSDLGALPGDVADDPRRETDTGNSLQLRTPTLGPVGNGTRRLAPPPTPEDTLAPIVSPPRQHQGYELWPSDTR